MRPKARRRRPARRCRVSIAYLAKVAAWSELPRAQVMTTCGERSRSAAPMRLSVRARRLLPRDGIGRFGGFAEHRGACKWLDGGRHG